MLPILASIVLALIPYTAAHGHGHAHDTAEHMRVAHGVYREPYPDGKNPLTLVEPPFLASDVNINLQTPAGDAIFAGLGTFGHLPFGACLSPITAHIPHGSEELAPGDNFDVGIIGMPFDTAVSFRPGARFGPSGIRHNSKRMSKFRGYNVPLGLNVYESGQKILDCGDIPVTAFDNTLALQQMEQGYLSLLHRPTNTTYVKRRRGETGTEEVLETPLYTKTGKLHPKMITLGGDHTLVLPVLRALNTAYGPVAVIHFDSHLDSWDPGFYGGEDTSKTSAINHGTFFWHASNEGLIRNGSATHAGIRTRLAQASDYDDDFKSGFTLQEASVIDDIGTAGIVENIRKAVAGNPVYLSIDIDVLDPSAAPATGTPETGGWSTRELRKIIRGLDGLDIIGADIVEVAPPYDTQASLTQMAAADLVWEILGLMVKRGPLVEGTQSLK